MLRTFTVVGIVRSFRLPVGLNSGLHPHLFLPADLETPGTELTVRVRDEDGRATLEVVDDGVGFDPRAGRNGHFGLRLVEDAAREAGGLASVDSEPGRGARIRVEIPTS